MGALYAYARFDDLDLDARSQWVGKGKTSALHALGNKASNKHYTYYNGMPFFYVSLTLQTVIWLDQLVYVYILYT